MTRMLGRAIALGVVLALPSCGIPPLRHPEAGPVLPADFNGSTSAENSSQLGIEEFYHDPTLTGLIYEALDGNRELKILDQEVEIASNAVLSRSGTYLPFVNIGLGGSADKPSRFTRAGAVDYQLEIAPGQSFPNPLPNALGVFTLFWNVDIWRQLRNSRDAAALRYVAAVERRNFFVTHLIADIAGNYYSLMALDKRLENLDQIIELQEKSLEFSKARKEAARGTQLAVLRFQAEVQRNRSEKLIVNQSVIETENRINFLLNRYPQTVQRTSAEFYDLNIGTLSVGVPSQLLQNRPDIRQAERELAAAGLDVRIARFNFFPQLVITAGVGYEAFNPKYFFVSPEALVAGVAGGLVTPLINKRAIKAEYLTANARQLQSIYNYQRVILNAFTEVFNRVSMVERYTNSIEIRKQQLKSLEASVDVASNLFQNARTEYIDVLFAQRDLRDARMVLIETKTQQLSAIVNAYQALGGGGNLLSIAAGIGVDGQQPYMHTIRDGESFRTISRLYYRSERCHKALWAANKDSIPDADHLPVGEKILIPPADQLDPALINEATMQPTAPADTAPGDKPVVGPALPSTSPPMAKQSAEPVGKADPGGASSKDKDSGRDNPSAPSSKAAATGK